MLDTGRAHVRVWLRAAAFAAAALDETLRA
jgi:hypothetical protein